MGKEVTIKINATDAASPVFKKLAGEAASMGATIETANQRGGRSMQDFNAKAAAMGAAFGTMAGFMSDWSRAAAEDQAQQARLQQAIENTGKSYSQYSQAVEKAIATGQKKAFSDDQIRDALVSLTAVTKDAGVSLNELGLAQDFARAKGIDLATSAEIIAKVYGGNLGILSRYGIQLDKNATSEQALAELQKISAGQADAYARTNAGWMDTLKIKVDELTESWGYQFGAMGKIIGLLPGMSAGFTAISSILAGLGGGAGGVAGLTKALTLGTQLAGAGALGTIAYGYAKDDTGTTFANDLANKIFLTMSSLINAAIPGSPFDTQKYVEQMAKNSTWDQINAVFGSPGVAASALGISGTTTTVEQVNDIGGAHFKPGDAGYKPPLTVYTPPSNDDIYAAIVNAAASGNMTVAQYLATPAVRIAAIGAHSTYQISGYVSPMAAMGGMPAATGPGAGYAQWLANGNAAGQMYGTVGAPVFGGAPYAPGTPQYKDIQRQWDTYDAGGSGAVANDISGKVATGQGGGIANFTSQELGNQQTQAVNELNDALTKRLGIYANLVNGQESVNDAMAQFKYTQDTILQNETVYSQQQTEYTSQVNAITAAHDLLNQKVADGLPLTQQEQDFQNNYNDALERGQGAVDDATIAQGLLAEQYLLNMKSGDALNQSMQDQTGAVGDLVDVVKDLIMNLNGIPPDVRTQIELMGGDAAIAAAREIQYALESAAGTYVANFIVTAVGGNAPEGPQLPVGGFNGLTAYANGGTAYDPLMPRFANGGSMYALVGEVGPEIVKLSRGDQVTPTGASRSQMSRMTKGGGGNTNFYGPVTLVPAGQDAHRAISQAALGEARY